MKALVSAIIVLLAASSLVLSDCPDGSFGSSVNNTCYFLVNLATNFTFAEQFCSDVIDGGHLASIHSATDDNNIYSNMYTILNTTAYWIGGFRAPDTSRKWAWTDGSVFDYDNWSNVTTDGHCILGGALWFNYVCNANFTFVCEFSNPFG